MPTLRGFSFLIIGCMALPAFSREWTDSTGKYSIEAGFIAYNEQTVVLKKQNHALVAIPIAKLSSQDQQYLKSKEVEQAAQQSAGQYQTWTMPSGLKVLGKVVDYGRREITVQRRRGKLYVNDRLFENFPEVYRRMLPRIIAHFDNIPIDDNKALESWAMKQRGEPRRFTCEGVVLELENGDEYGVPFFFFSQDDLKILQPGWKRWLAAEKSAEKQQQESFLLQSQAQAYQQDRLASQQVAVMQLQMEAYSAGLFDLWEVQLYPGQGVVSPPLCVVVPGRDSRAAATEALRLNPGFVAGPVSRVNRRRF